MRWSPIIELRQYTLLPGRRDVLIDIFEAHHIEGQEAHRIKVIGSFRDLDDETKFIWIRGFETMESRARNLRDFYAGPVWLRERAKSVANLVDSDNVLLLRPAVPDCGFVLPQQRLGRLQAAAEDRGVVEVLILHLESPPEIGTALSFGTDVCQAIYEAGGGVLATFVTEESKNSFPTLPVREGEHVIALFTGFSALHLYEESESKIGESVYAAASAISGQCAPMQRLRLLPTPRSSLAGVAPA